MGSRFHLHPCHSPGLCPSDCLPQLSIAEYVNVPYVEVIKAAAVPAFASYAALFYITHIEASKLGLKGMPR